MKVKLLKELINLYSKEAGEDQDNYHHMASLSLLAEIAYQLAKMNEGNGIDPN